MISCIDVNLKKEIIEDMSKIIGEIHQKFIENTGIPRNRLLIDLGSNEGNIGKKTVWFGNKIKKKKKKNKRKL